MNDEQDDLAVLSLIGVLGPASPAPAQVLPAKPMPGGGETRKFIKVANETVPSIQVVNISLGRLRSPDEPVDNPLHAAFQAVTALGITVVTAEGNQDTDFVTGGVTDYEVSDWVPAGYPEALAVASATAKKGTKSAFCTGTALAAAPHVAGAAALMWEKAKASNATLDPEQIRGLVRQSADRKGAAPYDSPVIGYTYDLEREGIVWVPGLLASF